MAFPIPLSQYKIPTYPLFKLQIADNQQVMIVARPESVKLKRKTQSGSIITTFVFYNTIFVDSCFFIFRIPKIGSNDQHTTQPASLTTKHLSIV